MSAPDPVEAHRTDPSVRDRRTDAPNVVVLVMDTARARETIPPRPDHLPTLATLAEEGTVFENAFASAPWTVPSHGSLFTGTHPSEHGAHGGHPRLDDGCETLPESFREAGYETVAISNNTWISERFGFDRGFETFRESWRRVEAGSDLGELRHVSGLREKAAVFRSALSDGNPIATTLNAVYGKIRSERADDGAARSAAWIDSWLSRRDDRPFFLFVNCIEPHIEYRPPPTFAEPYLPDDWTYGEAVTIRQDPRPFDVGEYSLSSSEFAALRALYRGELAYLDDRIGELRDALSRTGEWEDTIMVVVGDHGENVGDHGFLGHQFNLYDTVLHVPLVIAGGEFTGLDPVDELVQSVDLVPTLLAAAGIDDPALRRQQSGRSLQPSDSTTPPEHVVAEYLEPQPSIDTLTERYGPLPPDVRRYDRSLRAVRTLEYKLIAGSDGHRELYHVASDPRETEDRSADEPATVARLEGALEEWQGSVDGPVEAEREAVEIDGEAQARLEQLGYL